MPIQTKNFELSQFSSISVSGLADLIIDQQTDLTTPHRVTVEAEEDLIPYLSCEVRDDRLHLGFNVPWWDFSFWLVKWLSFANKHVNYHVTLKNFSGCSLNGSGTVTAENLQSDHCKLSLSGSGKYIINTLQSKETKIRVSGSGSVKLGELAGETLDASFSGSGKLEASGKVTQQTLRLSGSGTFDTPNLETQETSLHISGSGSAKLNVQQRLDVHISGSASIRYHGNPQIEKHISGSGSIRKLD